MRWRTWLTIASGLIAILVIVDMILLEKNHALQAEVNARAQFIQETVPLDTLNREIIAAIANLSVHHKDEALKTVLTQHGIVLGPSPSPASSPQNPAPVVTGRGGGPK